MWIMKHCSLMLNVMLVVFVRQRLMSEMFDRWVRKTGLSANLMEAINEQTGSNEMSDKYIVEQQRRLC